MGAGRDAGLARDPALRAAAPGLVPVTGFALPVRCSAGLEQPARKVAGRCSAAYRLLGDALGPTPIVALEVLGVGDWTSPSLPYGMPYYGSGRLVVAGEAADFWRSFVPLLGEVAPELHSAAVDAYGPRLDLSPFFDLLAMHELGHAFHDPGGRVHWLEETFANLCLHTCVAAAEPTTLPALEAFPRALASLDPARFAHRNLAEFEAGYSKISATDPRNYGWFQCHFHVVAKLVHDQGGTDALRRLWRRLASPDGTPLSGDQLTTALDPDFDVELAHALLRWVR